MTRAVIALGSNLGDRLAHLRAGVRGIAELGEIAEVSSVYETVPVGVEGAQRPYLNAVLVVETPLGPRDLLLELHRIERASGRERRVVRAPRTLDLDLVFHGTHRVRETGLTLPHPRWHERPFVLVPLVEAAPDFVDPETGTPVDAVYGSHPAPVEGVRMHLPPSALLEAE